MWSGYVAAGRNGRSTCEFNLVLTFDLNSKRESSPEALNTIIYILLPIHYSLSSLSISHPHIVAPLSIWPICLLRLNFNFASFMLIENQFAGK